MTVKIIVLATNSEVGAVIKEGDLALMPSVQEGWRFDFKKQLKKLKNAAGYILVREDTPAVIEECMIFQLIDGKKPYMSFIEVAPRNKGVAKMHDRVAGCLIAYAFKLSLMKGVGEYRGMLFFSIGEPKKEDEIRLMALYSVKYKAQRLGNSNIMIIYDEQGEQLIERYLN